MCDSLAGWWWSSLLLCWVTVACPVAHAEASRRGLAVGSALAYVTVAFLGAVSLAFPLFLSHLLVLPRLPPPRATRAAAAASGAPRHAWLWPACTLAALLSIVALPLSVHNARPVFIAALACLHVVLAVPFAAQSAAATGRQPVAALSPTQLRILACLLYTSPSPRDS